MPPFPIAIPVEDGSSLVFLELVSGLAERRGGVSIAVGAGRVASLGALAMGDTAALGALFRRVLILASPIFGEIR